MRDETEIGGKGMGRIGTHTWTFPNEPRVIARATSAGKVESEGPFGELFDIQHHDDRVGCDTWEHAEQTLFTEAVDRVLVKSNLTASSVDMILGGDLNAQLTGFYFGTRSLPFPALGLYSACATICQALALAALLVETGHGTNVVVGTSSHVSSAERQFRYPTEYGIQKPPTAQRTVTGAGAAILAPSGGSIAITSATLGVTSDYGITSPWEMGAAMAPAAASTIVTHLRDTGRTMADYDCIATGDLGRIGHEILKHQLTKEGITDFDNLTDCGMLIFRPDQPEVFSGGSGGACCTLVTFAHLLRELETGTWRRILISATGALLSSVSAQQKDSIPSVSHAIEFERRDG